MSDHSTNTATDVTRSSSGALPSAPLGHRVRRHDLPVAQLAGPHHDPPPALLVDDVSGPGTIVALGEDCLVCEDGLEPGQVYVFCRDTNRSGVAHESCAAEVVLQLSANQCQLT